LLQVIQDEANKKICQECQGVTDKTLKNIAATVCKHKFTPQQIPNFLLSKRGSLTKASLLVFLKMHTPYKKYHEGRAIKQLGTTLNQLKETPQQNKSEKLKEIRFLCFKLFDYPRVNDDICNDITILCQAIPRHWIIINAAFNILKKIEQVEKQIVYDAFLENILVLQCWSNHRINIKNKAVPLTLNLLKEKVLEFATVDINFNFSMKHKPLTLQARPRAAVNKTATVFNI
jgi:hypothetical protein